LKEGSRNEFKIHVVPFPGESNANSVSIDLFIKYGPVYPRKPPLLRLVPSSEGYSLAPSLRVELDEKLQQQVCEDLPRPHPPVSRVCNDAVPRCVAHCRRGAMRVMAGG